MSSQIITALHAAQEARLSRFSVLQSVDIHCHCLANLDDGPASLSDSIASANALVADGITHVIATPHQLGSYQLDNSAHLIRERVRAFSAALAKHRIPLDVSAGADVRLDERLLKLLDQDEVLTLADAHRYILLELPHDVLIDPTSMLRSLKPRGIVGIISHPERHPSVIRRPEIVLPWLEAGALLQVTSASLCGSFGPLPMQTAWRLVVAGFVALVASDAHGPSRPPMMSAAIDALQRRLGHGLTRKLCIDNPARVLEGSAIAPSRFSSRAYMGGVGN